MCELCEATIARKYASERLLAAAQRDRYGLRRGLKLVYSSEALDEGWGELLERLHTAAGDRQ